MSSSAPYGTSPNQCVLVINTGGTFGMKKKGGAYTPASHDELLDVLRHSENFGKWKDDIFTISEVDGEKPRYRPGTVSYRLAQLGGDGDRKGKKDKKDKKDELLDSSNMTPDGWNKIANTIKQNYPDYIGFVVIHGTDTMVYSASILSFMLENLGKPVVITGAQIPIFEARSDARDNLINSVIIAATSKIPQVLLCFGKNAFRGNRCVKNDASGFDAFISPNHPPLVELGVSRKVNVEAVGDVGEGQQSHNSLRICEIPTPCNVGILRLYPGITEDTVNKTLDGMKGVVLQSFGAGNAPDKPWFTQALKKFTKSDRAGGFMINVTQCHKGTVTSAYACGKMLKDECGVLAAGDMTEEAAFCKLCYLLAKSKNDSKCEIIRKLKKPLRGEMTESETNEE